MGEDGVEGERVGCVGEENAKPALVVASALKPRPSSARTLPGSHGLGITKQPLAWSALNCSRRAWGSGIAMGTTLVCGANIALGAGTRGLEGFCPLGELAAADH